MRRTRRRDRDREGQPRVRRDLRRPAPEAHGVRAEGGADEGGRQYRAVPADEDGTGAPPGENGVEVFAVAESDLPGQTQRGPPVYGPPAGRQGARAADQTVSRHLPFRVRRFRMALPFLVRLRCMKPCRRARRLFLG